MVRSCVCPGCTNSPLSGHRMHSFPNKESPVFYSWVKFVQVKRQGFSAASVYPKTSHICSAHFLEKDYSESDILESRMGFKSEQKVRLKTDAVPTVHVTTKKPSKVQQKNKQQLPSCSSSPAKLKASRKKIEVSRVSLLVS